MKTILLTISVFLSFIHVKAQLKVDAGNDIVLCFSDSATSTAQLGGLPVASGGVEPYTYTWSGKIWQNYGPKDSMSVYASYFLNDTTQSNPTFKRGKIPFDWPVFNLKVEDAAGNVQYDTVKIIDGSIWILNSYIPPKTIKRGDSIKFYGDIYFYENKFLPMQYTFSPTYGLTDPTDLYGWAKPDTSTTYYLQVVNSVGCVAKISYWRINVDTTTASCAHDYQTVYANQTAFFNNSSKDQIKGLRVDSVKVAAADTILYPFATIQEVSAGCFSPYKASWLGEKIVIKPDFSNLFFNRAGDTIILKTNARLNETWIAFQRADTFRVEARVQAAELGTVLGISDSVKTIGFRLLDQQGNTVDHALNKLKVKISKMHGFVETLNFYLFPDIFVRSPHDMLMSYTLAGLTNPKVGVQNLTWFDVNGFNPGDELHVQEHNIGDPNFFLPVREYDNRCIYKYLERTNHADSIVYRYARKQSIKTVYTDSTTLVTYNDTVRSVVLANPGFDKLPGEPIFQGNSAQQMYMRDDEFRTKIRPSAMNELYVYSGNGDCWSTIAGEGCLPEIRYIDGLGGPYYYCRGYVGEIEERKLVYYKKGETEWGEKMVITGVRNLKTHAGLQVFPNPARNVVTFQLNDDAGTHEVRIYNQNGSLVKTEQFKGSTCKIKLTGFKSGIYFYRLTSSTSTEYSGKLVVD